MPDSESSRLSGEEGEAWIRRMIDQVRDHAPACLSQFDAQFIPPPDGRWDHGVAWRLACACGCKEGQVLGYSLQDLNPEFNGPLTFVSPLAFQCADCDQVTEIIDTERHGYDGELNSRFGGGGSATYRGSGPRALFHCSKCHSDRFKVAANFLYSHFDIIEDDPELENVAQDFFDWFQCLGACVSCGLEQSIGDYELA